MHLIAEICQYKKKKCSVNILVFQHDEEMLLWLLKEMSQDDSLGLNCTE